MTVIIAGCLLIGVLMAAGVAACLADRKKAEESIKAEASRIIKLQARSVVSVQDLLASAMQTAQELKRNEAPDNSGQ